MASEYTTLTRMCVWKTLNKKGDVKFVRTVWIWRNEDSSFDTQMRHERVVAQQHGGDRLSSLPTCEYRKGYHAGFRDIKISELQSELDRLNADHTCFINPAKD